MAQFLKHESCPKCGSRDNVGVWDDGGKQCFTAGCNYLVHSLSGKVSVSGQTSFRLPPLSEVTNYARGISPKTYSTYRVGVSSDAVVFPCHEQGACVGAKFRSINDWESKKFYWKGGSVGLFGMHAADNSKKGIIITEGEFDALAAYDMAGLSYSCVSVTHGADGALKDVGKHVEWLNTFKYVYICFDNDGPGEEAAAKVLSLFRPGKAKRILLPMAYKDANEMLEAGKAAEFIEALNTAQGVTPEGLIGHDDVYSEILGYRRDPNSWKAMTTGYDKLDELTGGIRHGEMTILCGDTGAGKTNLMEQIAYNAMQTGLKVLWITLEMPPMRVMEQFIEKHLKKPYYSALNVFNTSDEEVHTAMEYFRGKLHIYKQFGKLDVDKVGDAIIHAAAEYGCQLVVIDHLALLTTGKEHSEIDAIMAELNNIALNYPVCIWAVAQLSRNDLIRGSQGINFIASSIVRMTRDKRTSVIKLSNLDKTYRYSPIGFGEFYLNYDKDTRTYNKISDKEAKEKIQSDLYSHYEGEEKTEFGKFEELFGRRDTKVHQERQELVRETDNKEQPECERLPVRSVPDEVHPDSHVYARLQLHLEERKAYLRGIERVPEDGGQSETESSNSPESGDYFKGFVSEFAKENLKSSQLLNLRRVVRPLQDNVGGGG